MNVNKKLARMKHWAGEKMGGEVKTNTSDEFKALEMEMNLRQEGMERLHKTMNVYIKSLSKRSEGDDKEKSTPIAQLGSTAISHADDFEPDSEFGQCLSSFGRANERIARIQESYVKAATDTWLDSLERSLAQMKEYQTAKKKLESRRLGFDTSQSKLQKAKKDDFRLEEELRSQKAKYEESSEDVYRRMLDIKEAEVDSIADLTSFIDAELNYYDRAREILLQLKQDWPVSPEQPGSAQRRAPRSRASTMSAYRNPDDEDRSLALPARSRVVSAQSSIQGSPVRERPGYDFPAKPTFSRTTTFEGPRSLQQRDDSPASLPRLSRVPTENSVLSGRNALRPIRTRDSANGDVFSDANDDDYYDSRSASPAPSFASMRSSSYANGGEGTRKMAPPPPPPSRSKKPPPPPPLKRSALSTSEI
ncbi:BAR domain-containing protein 1 [Elsinoe australis]|uniref:BAR domain-containing protein 1 n=1 Tax=Elsinoe australis TaxID=40998 RepID=A0A4U7B0N2_9PEZI|nr:BAR domain-containing protein 1 [Elsinoe australis]